MPASGAKLTRLCTSSYTKSTRRALLPIFYCTPHRPASTVTTANGVSVDGRQDNDHHKQMNAWQQPGPAAYDFRSDTITTPTASMLEAISNATLMDDVYVEDPTTNALEADMAALAGHEAALLVMSGTMGNQVALRTLLTQPPHSVLCDYRAHILVYEAGGVSSLTGAQVMGVRPSNGVYLTLEDVKKNVILSDNVHMCPTRVISLENTLSGTIMPLEEVQKISAFARENDIKMHLDGARIWEAVAANAGSLPEFTTCFESVSMCFSKGLGAPIGSIIVGSVPFIKHARRIRKSIGGGTRQAGIIAAAARVAVEEGFGKGPRGEGGKLRACHTRAKKIGETWKSKGGKLTNPTETNMIWLDLDAAGCSTEEFVELAKEEGLKTSGGRLVAHYQVSDDAVTRLEKVMDRVLKDRPVQNGH
jgi:threonine aldolase